MADGLEGLFDKPAAAFENALTSLSKKAAASTFQKFKVFLSTASEPFFRKDMGERYLGGDALMGGAMIWIGATVLALCQASLRSPVPLMLESAGYFKLARQFHFCLDRRLTLAAGGLLIFFHLKFGIQSIARVAKFRAAGTPYHSQSRGTPRWGGNEAIVGLAVAFVLLVVDMPAGILFVISLAMSSKLASEQQAAIYARYLDALDQKVEQEYLEDAILGKCPSEITQLHKPLAANLDSDMRNNIAAAAVGKPVSMVAKAPRPGASRSGPSGPPPTHPPNPATGQSTVGDVPGDTPHSEEQGNTKTPASKLLSNKAVRVGTIAVSATALTAWAAIRLLSSNAEKAALPLATVPNGFHTASVSQSTQAPVIPQPRASPPLVKPAVEVKSAVEISNSAAIAQAALDAQHREAQEKAQAALEAQKRQEAERLAALEKEKVENRENLIGQINATLTNQIALLSKYNDDCQSRLDNNTNRLAKVSASSRRALTKNNDEFRVKLAENMRIEASSLDNLQKDLQAVASNPQLDPAMIRDQATKYIAGMDRLHKNCISILDQLDAAISNAPQKKGLFNFGIK